MKPFNAANSELIQILVQDFSITPIDLENIRTEFFLYSSEYPLEIVSLNENNHYFYNINLYQWIGASQCLKLIRLQFKTARNAEILYVENSLLSQSNNQLGKSLVKNEKFLSDIKPLILKGFREITFKNLLDSK